MKMTRTKLRVPLSIALAVALATAFSFTSLASGQLDFPLIAAIANTFPPMQDPTATLTARGEILVNGTAARTGMTVMNGSLIITRTGAHATVELGPLGQVKIEPLTAATVTMMGNMVQVSIHQCGSVELSLPPGVAGTVRVLSIRDVGVFSTREEVDVDVFRGSVTVRHINGTETIVNAGSHREYKTATDVTTIGDTIYRVRCHEDHVKGAIIIPPTFALLLPFGGDDEEVIPPVLSPLAP